ncbi:AP-4 complex subunit beta-1-like isoform X2 [Physella acuta]|uniref:AP-4 complex subunit beta-1-like isoform X2 n=1 Tax=Physella acuta TaxID=109671 RepID=UPI0027DE9B24|nr:AP-4 complex subunit beta-1-like isoform X2 [Physella acuta]
MQALLLKELNLFFKILSLQTSGFDVTSALPTIVKLLALSDVFIKRVAGEIITILAQNNPEMVLLATNTLVQDCKDVNPVVRSLGLRLLGSLQSNLVVEMLNAAVIQGLDDNSQHVRRCAALASAHLHRVSPTMVTEGGIWDSLYGHLNDSDSSTVASCLCALEEIFTGEKGIVISNKLGLYLINSFFSHTPTVQRFILQFLLKHSPRTKSLVFDQLNLLDDCLSKSHSLTNALCTMELFSHVTSDLPKVLTKVYITSWECIKMHLARERDEEMVAAVIDYLSRTNFPSSVLEQDYSKFCCREDDAQFLMKQKIKILCKLITVDNADSILNEFVLIARRLDLETVKEMVWSVAAASSLKPEINSLCVDFVKKLFQIGVVGITECVLEVLSSVTFSDESHWPQLAEVIQNNFSEIESTNGQLSLLQLIKSYGEYMDNAPKILEHILDQLNEEKSESPKPNKVLKICLLEAMVKVCLYNPAKIQPLLGNLMEECISDESRNVRDQAMFLYGYLLSKARVKNSTLIC